MSPPSPARTLPLRVPVAAGESMDSWLEALARRNQVTVSRLVAALGWRVPGNPGGLVAGIPGTVLRRIEHQAGLPAGRLGDAVLDRYLPLGPVRRGGSRYCPSCLAEQDSRWLLAWRLPWIFACLTHRVLLRDTCPACGQEPRTCTGTAAPSPAGTCTSSIAQGKLCGADLRENVPQQLAQGSPVLAAQHWTATLLGLAGPDPPAAAPVLADLGIVASWVLRQAPASHFAGFGADTLATWHQWHAQPPATRDTTRRSPPSSAVLTAALAATAMTLLAGDGARAAGRIRALMPAPAGRRGLIRPAGMPGKHWKQLSGPARGRFLRALDPDLTPAERIRYRTGTPMAAIPGDPPGLLAARARMIPQLLWPDWAIRLAPAGGLLPGPFRSTLAACLLLPGHPAGATSKTITGLHAYRSAIAISSVLRNLAENGHDTVITAVSCLAGYLDAYGSPIDYQRRRDIIPAETITTGQWRDLCSSTAAHPGQARRHQDAQRYLFQLLTGADLYDPRHSLAFASARDATTYLAFTGTLTTGLRAALHDHAAAILRGLGIGEPLAWQPPPDCCAHLDLPGPGPAGIGLDAARRRHIPSRPPGMHSHPKMITRLGADIPRDIRRAVESGLNGWHRLRRFQAAMTFPTIKAAAAHLGTHRTALGRQLKRLESDIGARLYHRSSTYQPMRTTQRGTALLQALSQPEVQALAADWPPAAPS